MAIDMTQVEAGGEWPPIDVIFQGGTIRLVQDDGNGDTCCVWFGADESHDLIGAIAKEGGYEAQTAEIARLRKELEIAATRFALYANYCDEYGWTATGEEFSRFAREARAALSPAPTEAP